jgi:hypothetical protein
MIRRPGVGDDQALAPEGNTEEQLLQCFIEVKLPASLASRTPLGNEGACFRRSRIGVQWADEWLTLYYLAQLPTATPGNFRENALVLPEIGFRLEARILELEELSVEWRCDQQQKGFWHASYQHGEVPHALPVIIWRDPT